ncbi:MAG: 23S rRNA (adenine(2503)-C(2))-methyltransferase RlmN [Bacteroidales bacterium]
MIRLIGITREELQELPAIEGLTAARRDRILYWLYKRRISNFKEMIDLPATLRKELASRYTPGFYPPQSTFHSSDGSKKYLFDAGEKGIIETVFLPEARRKTLCVSVQAGCRMGCSFCSTGAGGYRGNLSTGEIINQFCSIPETGSLTHVVFMGMGEPFDNYENVIRAIRILTAEWGLALGAAHITVSTVGVLPYLKSFLADTRAHVAISLHSPFPEERKRWMPVENKFPVRDIVQFLSNIQLDKRRRISFEYAMVNGINDSQSHALALTELLNHQGFRINLIPFNPVPGLSWSPSDDATIRRFRDFLDRAGIPATIRKSRGADIGAACGLLAGSR